jgi:hypothetical protein
MASVKYTLKSGTEDVTGVTIDSWFDIMAERNSIIRDITQPDAPFVSISETTAPDNNIDLLYSDVSQVKVTTISLQDQTDVITSDVRDVNTRLDTVDEILATLTGTTDSAIFKAGSVRIDDFASIEGRYEYAVAFDVAYPTTNYAVSINYNTAGSGFIMTSYGSKTIDGFTIYLSGLILPGEEIDWVTIPY